MEHRMDVHRQWQFEPVGERSDWANNNKGPQATHIQFGRGTRGRNVAAQEPHFLAWDKNKGRPTAPIGEKFRCFPGLEKFSL